MRFAANKYRKTVRVFLVNLCLSVFICGYDSASASSYPQWWIDRNVVTNVASTNDWAGVNAGQLKWFATNAYDELNANLPGGAGTNIANMIAGFSTSSNNYIAINMGQLKYTASKFYDRLIQDGFTNTYPWSTNTTADDMDYAMANIGQVKNVFGFDLSGWDSDSDGLPDWWELQYYSELTHGASFDGDGDGLTSLQEYQNGTNPLNPDTDGDGLNDGQEVNTYHTSPLIADTDGDGLSDGGEVSQWSNVICWGSNDYGERDVPAGLTGVVAIAAGEGQSMALKSNSTVVCWGSNYDGQTNVPAGLTGVVAIDAGSWHCMALESNGTVVCWGYNDDGQTNVPAGLTGVVAIDVLPNRKR
jgi:hypothetical protein